MKKYQYSSIIIFFTLLSSLSFGQNIIRGTVVDKNTNTPLPFVNILYSNNSRLGTTSDLDGRFEINSKQEITNLEFSFMGYKTQEIKISNYKDIKKIKVKLESTSYDLPNVDVFGQDNPAHRIINRAIKNRKANKPESLSSYKYDTYSKMFFTFDVFYYKNNDTINSDNYQFNDTLSSLDSNIREINKFKEDQYLFLMESVTEKKYKRPGKVHEEVLASRVSGLQNPAFTLLSTQLQSFTIYSDYITVGNNNYLSPLAKNSTKKYIFIIEDTLINKTNDTTYTLSYRPRKNKNFRGLEGILQINTNGFAVENFSTKPTEQEGVSVIVRQQYEYIQDSAWFPKQLDADFTFRNIVNFETRDSNSNGPDKTYIYGKAKTYISNIDLNKEIKNKEFSHIEVDYDQKANKKDSLFWSKYRVDTISKKELNTYKVIDSLGKELNFEKQLRLLSYLSKGEIPLGFLSFHLDKLMSYNVAEGFRLGAGLSTNERVCKNANIGGYGAYAFGDYKWKYGGNLKINLRDYYDSHFEIKYKNDIAEVGGFNYLEANPLFNPETYRDYLINKITYEESVEAALELRFAYYLKARIYAKYSETTYNNNFYQLDANNNTINDFKIPEAGIKIRYAYHEHYIRTPMGITALKTKYPIFFFNISKSLVFDNYNINYTRLWGKIEKKFIIRNAGVSYISLQGGYVYGEVPYFKLFNGHGSYYPFTIVALNSFGTMRMNEFISDQFVYLFYRHNFGSLLFKGETFKPEFSLVQNMGWGDLNNPEQQLGVPTKSMSKGFFESGLLIDNIIQSGYTSLGIGVFYRYGPYAFDNTLDNFGFKMSLTFNL